MASTLDQFAAREFYSVVIGGTALAGIAGFINAVSLAGVYAATVAHVTGNVTKAGMALAAGNFTTFGIMGGIIGAFTCGSFVSGFVIDSTKFQLGSRYGLLLMVESLALFMSCGLRNLEMITGELVAAFACGLQNAIATNYSGAVIRTTHMTGICTDIGIVLGQAASRNPRAETWKLKVLVPLLAGFFGGSMAGSLCYQGMGPLSMLIPASAVFAIGLFYLTWKPARKAREVLVTAVKKVQNEIELGIRTVATPIMDFAKHHTPTLMRSPSGTIITTGVAAAAGAAAGVVAPERSLQHPIPSPSTPTEVLAKTRAKEELERKIDRVKENIELQSSPEDVMPLTGNDKFELGDGDEDDDN
ncbi:hypothetical protein GGF32_004046 [Allomyces javanicus]|nr:hypothetical protein GGF32_004046 [Allomyces javanicus]